MKCRIPSSHRDFAYTRDIRNSNNTDMGTGGNNQTGGGVSLPPPIVFRAPLGGTGKPEGAGRHKK